MNLSAMGIEQAVLEYVANAVWQVPLVFAAAWGAARLARRSGPAAEHRVWVAAVVLEAILPMCRFDPGALWRWVLAALVPTSGDGGGTIRVALGAGETQATSGMRLPAEAMTAVALAFAGSAIYFAVRLGWGLWRTEALRRQAGVIELRGEAKATWLRLGGRSTRAVGRLPEILVSRAVYGPVTIGVLRPAVLLPAEFLEAFDAHNLEVGDFEAVLAHELAHVRRLDFLKNALYEAMSLAVAWHPAVWLTRARVAESREMVCDAMAADVVAGREKYARSLLRLAATVVKGTPDTTLHAIGIFDANSFERRVMNLTMKRVALRRMQRVGIAAACAVVVLATCATAMALRVEIGPGVAPIAPKGASGATANPKVEVGELKIVSRVMPVYPPEAKANHDTLDGPVVLEVTIGKDGAVEEVHVVKSLRADYDRSALESVRTWRWEPYLLNGEPTEVDSTVTVNYSIPHDQDTPRTQASAEMDKVGPADVDSSQAKDTMPKLIHQVEAVYPAEARARKDMLNGSVILGLTVAKDGSIEGVHIDKSLRADYDKSALAAVKQYRFEPAAAGGKPVAKSIVVEVNFQSY